MLIKNSTILSKEFVESFANLMSFKMPAKQCLEVSSCVEDILSQHQILVRARKAIADKYCKKENGVPLIDAVGDLVFETEEIKSKCLEELKEIYDEEVDIALSDKVRISKMEIMTPIQVKLLKDIIEIVD